MEGSVREYKTSDGRPVSDDKRKNDHTSVAIRCVVVFLCSSSEMGDGRVFILIFITLIAALSKKAKETS